MINSYSLFFDDGGVLNDNELRESEWRILVGEYFVPKFGGTMEQWATANKTVFDEFLARFETEYEGNSDYDFEEMWRKEDLIWIDSMIQEVGVEMNMTDDKKLKLVRDASVWIIGKVDSAIPGMVDIVTYLFKEHYRLYMALSSRFYELEGYLTNMNIRHMFTGLYGPDLISTPKSSSKYYCKIFKKENLRAEAVIVIDDTPSKLEYAKETGHCDSSQFSNK
ncbi:MAG: HAD hydrolase-like protein [Candidatus Heimdallarchaeota archaeon]|nr:HAD hydrolase-like protein [Candidatus Heimdallarchaeota archaeon]